MSLQNTPRGSHVAAHVDPWPDPAAEVQLPGGYTSRLWQHFGAALHKACTVLLQYLDILIRLGMHCGSCIVGIDAMLEENAPSRSIIIIAKVQRLIEEMSRRMLRFENKEKNDEERG